MSPATLRALTTRTLPAGALLLAVTGCSEDVRPSSPASAPGAAPHRAVTATAPPTPSDRNPSMNIRLTIDGHQIDATLNASAAARDFAALLPLTLNLSDFHQTERIADLPRRLSTSGAPDAAEARPGDLAYYAPWGNLALFYRGSGSSDKGLIILGHLNGGDTEHLAIATEVTIEAAS
ncbi:cyclophilin-like fold protein [Streptomyces sp. NPDC046909]|uniref:cyclophilin-like fold protein n=1 Tax=Streptomyces sp. NPDC046909 TaxID=3155617 RepID=UPI0033DF6C56